MSKNFSALCALAVVLLVTPDLGHVFLRCLQIGTPFARAACTLSTLAPEYDCQLEFLGGESIIHYKAFADGDVGAQLAAEAPREQGWIAFGFHPPGSPRMVGSTAVIATDTAEDGGVGVFDLNQYAASGVVEVVGATATPGCRSKLMKSTNVPFTITDASVERTDGKTILRFTRPFDDTFSGADALNSFTAFCSGATTISAKHDATDIFSFSLSEDNGITTFTDPAIKHRRNHAILMIASWGLLLPLGVAMANTLHTFGPIWYHLHRIIQICGLVLATAGFIIALTQFEAQDPTYFDVLRYHRVLGIAVMVFGWCQPLNALLCPHAPKKGESRSSLRLAWEIIHKGLGYIAILLSVIVIFLGLKIGESFPPFSDGDNHSKWMGVYVRPLIALVAAWALMGFIHFIRMKKQANSSENSHSPNMR